MEGSMREVSTPGEARVGVLWTLAVGLFGRLRPHLHQAKRWIVEHEILRHAWLADRPAHVRLIPMGLPSPCPR